MFELISEQEQFEFFQSAYLHATGQRLRLVRKSERPDFICHRPDGSLVGIEFTLITRTPGDCFWPKLLDGVEYMNGFDGVFAAGAAIMRKGEKRVEHDWQLPASSILVLYSPDCPIDELEYHLDAELQAEFEESGFTEIWIADHTQVEAYGCVDLFCLAPKELWGYYAGSDIGKPYG
jgi:hypothetical protein